MSRIEKEEKNTHVDWIAPINLQRIAWNLGYFFELQNIPNHVLSEGPIVGEDVDEGERHAEGAEQDIGHSQRRDEHVPCCEHHLVVILMILVIVMIIIVFHIKASVFQFKKLCKEVF